VRGWLTFKSVYGPQKGAKPLRVGYSGAGSVLRGRQCAVERDGWISVCFPLCHGKAEDSANRFPHTAGCFEAPTRFDSL
jgi:hypothetical protein